MDEKVPVFLVGNSMGANLVTKYLGEEGLSGTLPACVAGAASLGNPLLFNTQRIKFPFNVLMGAKRKQQYIQQWRTFSKMTDPLFQESLRKMLLSTTIGGLDRAAAPIMARNEAFYPFVPRVGYKSVESYFLDSGSYRHARYISVPLLQLTAEDDFLVHKHSKAKLGFCVPNPNVMVVETRCGGHLGWQESPPESNSSFGFSSWSDIATADFFDSIMQVNVERTGSPTGTRLQPDQSAGSIDVGFDLEKLKAEALSSTNKLHSRL
jgi:predicted alpha/beta-fold hydrolase